MKTKRSRFFSEADRGGGAAPEKPFAAYLPDGFEILAAERRPEALFYPPFSDRAAWEKAAAGPDREKVAAQLIENAEVILSEHVSFLSLMDLTAYKTRGNRSDYESGYFRRRDGLGMLVLAMCLTGDREKYLPGIAEYLWSICGERYWCIPAHADYRGTDPLPDDELTRTSVDLFAAVTAAQVALALAAAGAELETFSPGFVRMVKQETLNRTVRPFIGGADRNRWFWLRGEGNWPVWICSNLLTAGALLLDGTEERRALFERLDTVIGRYWALTPADGFCDEGPGYWTRSSALFFLYAMRLDKLLPGSAAKLYADPKTRNMLEFPARIAISPEHMVNFGDGAASVRYQPALLYAAGNAVHSEPLRQFAGLQYARLLENLPILKSFDEKKKTRGHFENGEFLSNWLVFFFDLPANAAPARTFVPPGRSVYENRLAVLHSENGFAASLKAGNNHEKHNHNDLGHFTLFDGVRPVVIDLGTCVYNAKTFSPDRYDLTCQGAQGHNAPAFGGVRQQAGNEYTASLRSGEAPDGTLFAEVDLARAYPPAAGLRSFTRHLALASGLCTVEDVFETEKPESVTLTLYSALPAAADGKTVRLGPSVMLDASGFDAVAVSEYRHGDVNLGASWGDVLYRIELAVQGKTRYALRFRRIG